jgi:hypothetical protein
VGECREVGETVLGEAGKRSTTHGLTFLALLSFVTSFLAARIFTTVNPTVVVVSGGIHFHHFWYGLIMVAVAGWLGIVYTRHRFNRTYAVVFGLGGGLIGDEVGLLLTLGDYNNDLTLFVFVIIVTVGIIGILLLRYEEELEEDVMSLGNGERIVYIGLVVAGLSALAFADGLFLPGSVIAVVGILVAAMGFLLHRRLGENKKARSLTA